MTTTPAKKQKTLPETLKEMIPDFQNVMTARDINAGDIVTSFLSAARRNPDLMLCSPQSVVMAVMQACELGLSLAPSLAHAYPVPFNNKKTGTKECTLIVGYKGFTHMMVSDKYGGRVVDITPVSVWENEPFSVDSGVVHHKTLPPDERGAKRKATYIIFTLKSGERIIHWMWTEDIMKHRARSRAREEGPWVTDPEAMERKTVLRDKVKWMGLGPAISKAAQYDEYNEVGLDISDYIPQGKILEATVKRLEEADQNPAPAQTTSNTLAPEKATSQTTEGQPEPEGEAPPVQMCSQAQAVAIQKQLERVGIAGIQEQLRAIEKFINVGEQEAVRFVSYEEIPFSVAVTILKNITTIKP